MSLEDAVHIRTFGYCMLGWSNNSIGGAFHRLADEIGKKGVTLSVDDYKMWAMYYPVNKLNECSLTENGRRIILPFGENAHPVTLREPYGKDHIIM